MTAAAPLGDGLVHEPFTLAQASVALQRAMSPRAARIPEYDIVVVGGGLVGASIAYGLATAGRRVAVLDEGDIAHRAARGNFALIWVQGKGAGLAPYGALTVESSALWPGFAEELRAVSGIDPGYSRPGGFAFCLSEAELDHRRARLSQLQAQRGMPDYQVEFLERARLASLLPAIGPEVAGASYCALDGHVNSLRLLRCLHTAFCRSGGDYLPEHAVSTIAPRTGSFRITTAAGMVDAGQVVLAAGISNARLAPMVGLHAPVRPQRGQIIVTEKTAPFLAYPTNTIRQADEGGVMIGDSVEETGCDNSIGLGVLGVMAARAIRIFPLLQHLHVVRSWAALRVMTQDGFPIYDQSPAAPGAFLCTCHSGVTLAAVHARRIAPLISGGMLEGLYPFSARRLHVPTPG